MRATPRTTTGWQGPRKGKLPTETGTTKGTEKLKKYEERGYVIRKRGDRRLGVVFSTAEQA